MELRAGDSLGPYEILAPLGRGGMGEVYRARDPRLRREVAIKLLREGTVGEHGLERFRRETRAVASLDHPNILAIHDMGMHGGVPYAVTELLDGETLAQRLQSGPLPPRTAAEFAAQIADGLAAAHTRGVVHRDIKPENIFLTQDGRAKILDFGLARIEKPPDDSLLSDTTEVDATRGHAVGTAGYIAPEQLRGKPADSRTDIFALGAVCYEMLTGRKAFPGPSVADRLAAVLHADPGGYAETGNIPEGLRRPILRCLEKEPADRYQSARDLLHDLRAWSSESSRAVSPHPSSRRVRWKRLLAAAAVGGFLLAVGIWVGRLGRTGNVAPVLDPPASRLLLSLSPPLAASVSERSAFALSPNGKHLVYCAEPEGRRLLFLRPLDTLESAPLPGTEEADGPFFSPDGQWIGFFTGRELKKIALAGGNPVVLRNVPPVSRGATWLPDDTIVFSQVNTGGLVRIPASTGESKRLTEPDYEHGEYAHRWPAVLPGGRAILFAIYTGGEDFDHALIAAARFDTGERKILIRGGTSPHYSPTGHLVFARGGTLFAVRFDTERLETAGQPVPLLPGVQTESTGISQFALAGATLAYLPGSSPAASHHETIWLDRKGASRPFLPVAGDFYGPRFSPDGRRVAFSKGDANQDIWIYDLDRANLSRLTPEPSEEFDPVWSPDGRTIAYSSERRAQEPQIFSRPSDGGGPERFLRKQSSAIFPQSWSPDGRFLAYAESSRTTDWNIWIAAAEGTQPPTPFLETPYAEAQPEFSPDGRWIAYVSNESGRFELYARPYPGPGGRIAISTDGGLEPVWGRNGRELFYRNGERMMAVPVKLGTDLLAGKPELLFERRGLYSMATLEVRSYDVSPDGRGFVMVQTREPGAPPILQLLMPWPTAWIRGERAR